ncbi:DUF998 domain-containing protein [Rhabdothermincola salaria]|uniref:DUF998 domain-containing protein n=1 Tax=Rhabdothermincola salaria TaxID=2903142 RepID=UPI001E3EC0BC|nr:DUF998 domain-containing protein [Rhabdothermincola salaria]MCD9624083.1 DUF998 domain-containing protein [Rhabdothermincola salaria]
MDDPDPGAGPDPGPSTACRVAALGGLVGPAAFIGAWLVGGAVAGAGYSPVDDAISRLAAVDADTRALMTAGFVVFGVSLPAYGVALGRAVPGATWAGAAAAATGLATLGVALTPLDCSTLVDQWHAVFAGLGYLTLAATPLLAARPLWRRGHRLLARLGVATGAVSGAALVLTATELPTGVFQRLGLTVTDLWIMVTAAALLTGRVGPTASAVAPTDPAEPAR